ncbi:hypothetical protein DFS34DRAFT_324920 [Phlyctochytrium arcticum]|nr:hypothetical protein DFS34DRAFT_324920 [Phlyctochytrium arcticum]
MELGVQLADYCEPCVVHFNPRTALLIQRSRRISNPQETVICKGNTFFDEDENFKLKQEYEILNLIHNNLAEIEQSQQQPGQQQSSYRARGAVKSQLDIKDALPPVVEDATLDVPSANIASLPPSPGPSRLLQNKASKKRLRSTSLGHDSANGRMADRVIKPIRLDEINGQYFLIMQDFGGVALREYLSRKRGSGRKLFSENTGHSSAKETGDVEAQIKTRICSDSVKTERKGAVNFEATLQIAIQLAEALEVVHAAQVIHKDINPDNIVVKATDDAVKVQLIDFNLAEVSNMGTESPQRTYLEGTLAYLSPEQTGRMQKVVDYRTDFYSLGITLWEVVVGNPPFQFDDATEYVHAHLAKEIEPACCKDPLIPVAFSDIIDKLVSKAPEERYQSASGLRYDLLKLQKKIDDFKTSSGGQISKEIHLTDEQVANIFSNFDFQIGSRDHSFHLAIPDKLYGRDAEIRQMVMAYENVAIGKSRSELVYVLGASGEGKSSLLSHLRRHVVGRNGFFACGQYSDYNRERPYGGFVQALDALIRQLLGEPPEVLERWQDTLTKALGPEALSIVTDVLPDLALIVGPQQVAEARVDASTAEQTAFIRAMQALISCFAQQKHPLVFFLDDLQFAEAASQKLMQAIFFDKRIAYLLIVATQPTGTTSKEAAAFSSVIQRIQFEAPQRLRRIELGPLSSAALKDMLSDTLRPSVEDVDTLVSLIYRKTMGNPFHIREFLRYSEQQGLIYFNEVMGGWAWDVPEMERQSILSEDVAELLLTRLRQLPIEAQALLQQAACIGDSFDLRTLSALSDTNIVQVATVLWSAVKEGFLLPQVIDAPSRGSLNNISRSSSGSFGSQVQLRQRSSMTLNKSTGGVVMSYKFCHTRLHQACYNMVDINRRKDFHLQIARILKRSMSDEERVENPFQLVSHYSEALDLITDPEEKTAVARYAYDAGMRVKKISTHRAARRYLETASNLLGSDESIWANNYELLFNIKIATAQIGIMEGAYQESINLLCQLSERAMTIGDQLKASTILVGAYHIQGRFNDILEMGLEEVKRFQIPVPEDEPKASIMVREELAKLESLIDGRSAAEVAASARPLETTSQMLQTVLLSIAGAASSLGRLYQSQYFYVKGCVLAMEQGLSLRSSELFAFILRAYAGCLQKPNFSRMRWISELVFLLMDKAPLEAQARARLGLLINGYVYVAKFSEFEDNIDKCITAGIESGYYSVVIYALCMFPGCLLSYGRPASAWNDWHRKYHPFVEKFKGYFLNVWNGTMGELDALTAGFECVYQNRDVMATGMSRAQVYYFRLVNSMLYNREDRRELLEQYKQEDSMNAYMGMPRYVDVFVWQVLIASSEWNDVGIDKERLREEIDSACAVIEKFAREEPKEIACKLHLVHAERERLNGNFEPARQLYDQALEAANQHGFRFHEALITELYGRFWLDCGSRKMAKLCLNDSYNLWYSWGCDGKCKQLQALFPDLITAQTISKPIGGTRFTSMHAGASQRSETTEHHSSSAVDLDLTTVLKVTQSISNETSLEILLTKIIKFVVENAGAGKGLLVLQQEGKLFIEALGIVDERGEHHEVLQHIPIGKASKDQGGPYSVINYVYRTREPLVLIDAAADQTYSKDSYVSERKTKSILCCPIVHQNIATGVVYLENNLHAGAFTVDRLELIQSLMVAASMSIENAKLAKTNTELTAALRESSPDAAPRYNLDGPVKKTIDMLQAFKFRLPLGDPGIRQIEFIMKALTSTDFFSSNIDEINDESGKGIDLDTKVWIENSLLQKEPSSRGKRPDAKEQMFAKRVEQNPKVSSPWRGTTTQPVRELSSINMQEVNALLEHSTSMEFNIYDLADATNGRPLYFLGVHLLERWGLLEHFSLDEKKLRSFFEQIEASYHPLPYHNSTHGADVLQTVNMLLLSDPGMAGYFTKLEIFSACIASAIHDVDHPGLNNSFLVQSSHPLAILYNDIV